jgi:antitoxin component YwqK of YwqJK toxin-antitoxin module
VVYGDNGNKRCELNYTDGQKSGIWTSWNEEGQITESKDYSKLN